MGLLVLAAGLFVVVGARGSWVKVRLAPHIGERERRLMRRKERLSLLAALYKSDRVCVRELAALGLARASSSAGTCRFAPPFIWASLGLGFCSAWSPPSPVPRRS